METAPTEMNDNVAHHSIVKGFGQKPGRGVILVTLAVIAIGLIAIGIVQSRAPEADFQNAYLLSMAIGLSVVLFSAIQMHRIARAHGHRFSVPTIACVAIVGAAIFFRWDGFSGEMVPQFRSRLAVNRPNQQVQVEPTAVSPQASLAETTAMSESLGFLGSQRNGVIRERAFGISASDDEPEILWEIGIGEGWSSFAVQGDRAVTMEQREQEEWLTCYRLLDGKLLWSKRHTGRHENPLGGIGPRSTPTIAGNRVYAQSATGFLWCVDIQSGSEYWTADLLQLAGWPQLDSEAMAPWGRSGSPLVVEGLCIVPFGAPDSSTHSTARSLIAFNADDGSEVWRAGDGQISYASPSLMTLAGKRQVVSVNENTVTGHDVETGKQLWSFRWPGQTNAGANCASAIQVDDTRFLIGKGYGGGSALVQINLSEERFDANEVWASSRVLKTKFSHACVDRDVAYAISNGILEAVSINDGELIWSQPRGVRAGAGQILLVEDTIVVQNEAGGIVFVQAGTDEYAELGRLDALESKTWNVPTIAGRHLLVRNDNQAMCFLLPPR